MSSQINQIRSVASFLMPDARDREVLMHRLLSEVRPANGTAPVFDDVDALVYDARMEHELSTWERNAERIRMRYGSHGSKSSSPSSGPSSSASSYMMSSSSSSSSSPSSSSSTVASAKL
ncbi:hypothetical protein HK102_008885 [Quaeritorhiza haematococci]|nr:hypothetical protein HK102_008885 [Quaeritorhiza haematococci]